MWLWWENEQLVSHIDWQDPKRFEVVVRQCECLLKNCSRWMNQCMRKQHRKLWSIYDIKASFQMTDQCILSMEMFAEPEASATVHKSNRRRSNTGVGLIYQIEVQKHCTCICIWVAQYRSFFLAVDCHLQHFVLYLQPISVQFFSICHHLYPVVWLFNNFSNDNFRCSVAQGADRGSYQQKPPKDKRTWSA